LKEIKLLKSEINLKDFEIVSLKARINKLEAKFKQIAQKALLKDNDTTQLLHNSFFEIRIKELKNELKKLEANKSKVKDVIESLIDHVCNKQKEKLDNIQVLSIVILEVFVRYMYGIISKDPKALYYENIQFSYISFERIPNMKSFSSERNTVIIFEDLYVALEYIQNQIITFFTHMHHRNISFIYISQYYHKVLIIIQENVFHLVIFNSVSNAYDIFKIIRQNTDDVKGASMVINSYLNKERCKTKVQEKKQSS
ncbi:10685_t:CDS:2, partial [Cetraspora pellucida]